MDSLHRYSRLAIAVAIAATSITVLTWAAAVPASVAGAIPHLKWTEIYGPTTNQDEWSDVAIGPGHTVYVCGTQGVSQGPGWLMTVAKFGADKTPLWETPTVPAVQTWSDGGSDSRGSALAVDHSGNMIVVGSSFAPTARFAVVKFSGADGHVMWKKDFMLVGAARATDVVLDKFGNAYVTGTAVGGMSTGRAIYTAKFRASDGKRLWENLYSGPTLQSQADAIAIDANRNTYVIGSTVTAAGSNDWVVRKISPAGKNTWTHRWNGAFKQSDMPSCLVVSKSAVYVVGSTQTDVVGSYDAVLVKYTLAGRRLWVKQFKHAGTDAHVYGLCFDSYGRLLLAGLRHPIPNGSVKTFLAKVTPADKTVWLRSQASSGYPLGAMGYYGIVRGPAGSMYLSGFEAPSASDTNIVVEKRTTAGKVAWHADYGWQDGGDDYGGALVRDGTAGLYVCGNIWTTTNSYDATLQKYKP